MRKGYVFLIRYLDLHSRSKFTFTASALKGVPSWNFTFSRNLNVNSVASSFARILFSQILESHSYLYQILQALQALLFELSQIACHLCHVDPCL